MQIKVRYNNNWTYANLDYCVLSEIIRIDRCITEKGLF